MKRTRVRDALCTSLCAWCVLERRTLPIFCRCVGDLRGFRETLSCVRKISNIGYVIYRVNIDLIGWFVFR